MHGWKRPFDESIPLPRGRQIVTLEDAARYIQGLPKTEHDLPKWQNAVEALLLVVQYNGPTMFARIGIMKALSAPQIDDRPAVDSPRKETHWGKRKLKRDQ